MAERIGRSSRLLEIAVERILFTIMPAYTGWQLFDDLTIGHWFTNKMSAIQAADSMAPQRHDETGQPTGVTVQTACGDWVLVCLPGRTASSCDCTATARGPTVHPSRP